MKWIIGIKEIEVGEKEERNEWGFTFLVSPTELRPTNIFFSELKLFKKFLKLVNSYGPQWPRKSELWWQFACMFLMWRFGESGHDDDDVCIHLWTMLKFTKNTSFLPYYKQDLKLHFWGASVSLWFLTQVALKPTKTGLEESRE